MGSQESERAAASPASNAKAQEESSPDATIEREEELLKHLMKETSEANRRIDDAYEEKLRRLEIKRKLVPDEKEQETHETRISVLKEAVNELKGRISDARREGKDMLMPELAIRNIGSKIKMAEATREPQDFAEVEKLLKRAKSELEEALSVEELNIKKEVEAKLRAEIARQTGRAIED